MKIYYDENKRLVLDGEELTIEVVGDDVHTVVVNFKDTNYHKSIVAINVL